MHLLVTGEHWKKAIKQEDGMANLKIKERQLRNLVKTKMDSLE